MGKYLKGTETWAYIRLMNDEYGILVKDDLSVRSVFDDTGTWKMYDKDGNEDTSGVPIQGDIPGLIFINPAVNGLTGWASNPSLEPILEVSDLGPDLGIQWDEFDAIGTVSKQYIPIRKELTLSFTQKAADAKWEVMLFGDYQGNFGHHGVHLDGTTPKLYCFEGKNAIGSDIGFQANIVLGQQSSGNWVVLRVMNMILHSCGMEIAPAAITNRTIEFMGNHGYLYAVADPFDPANLEWTPSVGAIA